MVTKEWLADRNAVLSRAIGAFELEDQRHGWLSQALERLTRERTVVMLALECLERREAEEGEVVVEGMLLSKGVTPAQCTFSVSVPFSPEASRFFEGEVVTIRRRAEERGGGDE